MFRGCPVAGSVRGACAMAAAVRRTERERSDVTFQAKRAYALVSVEQFSRYSLYALVHQTAGSTSGMPQRHPVSRLKGTWTITFVWSTWSPAICAAPRFLPSARTPAGVGYQTSRNENPARVEPPDAPSRSDRIQVRPRAAAFGALMGFSSMFASKSSSRSQSFQVRRM